MNINQKQPRVPRARRRAICAEYSVEYSSRQWVKLRKRLQRAVRAAKEGSYNG